MLRYNQIDQTYSPMPVTLNSFAAFADPGDIPAATVARYAPGGDINRTLTTKYGSGIASQVYAAAQNGDRESISRILGGAIPLNQSGGGTVVPQLDESVTNAFISQIINDPLAAPIDAALGKGSSGMGGISTTGMVLIGLGALGLFVVLNKS